MRDITNPRLLVLKGILFVVLGILATTIIFILHPSYRLAVLLAIAIWAFCRAYYFAFYVIQHYIDPEYRFAGLVSAIRHLCRRRRGKTKSGGRKS